MTHLARGVAAAVLVLLLPACAAPTAGAAAAPAAAPAVAAPLPPAVVDVAYLAALERHGLGTGDDQRELRRAHAVCDLFHAGGSFRTVVEGLQVNGFTAGDAGAVIGLAVAAYCPDQADKIRA